MCAPAALIQGPHFSLRECGLPPAFRAADTSGLGTAAGDLAAEGLQLGYGLSVLIFGGVIAAVTLAHYKFRLNAIAAFWIAYILTRPLGASFGDLLARPMADGGLGLGNVITSGLFLVTLLALVSYLTLGQKKVAVIQ